MKNLEPNPRWKGAPAICIKANLPAFETADAAAKWHGKNCPGLSISSIVECKDCDGWHVNGYFPVVGGSSGGSTRNETGAHRMTLKQRRHIEEMSDQSLREWRLAQVTTPEPGLPKQKKPMSDARKELQQREKTLA